MIQQAAILMKVAAGGLALNVGGIVAQAADTGASIAPWAQAGGTATAVAALGYVAKLLADGRLVAQPVAELLTAASKREDRLVELLEEASEREHSFRLLLLQQTQGRP